MNFRICDLMQGKFLDVIEARTEREALLIFKKRNSLHDWKLEHAIHYELINRNIGDSIVALKWR